MALDVNAETLTESYTRNEKGSDGGAEEGFASGEDILEGFLEITCVPRIRDIAAGARTGHQQMDFALRVGRDYSADPA